eukprot:m.89360 g.89360  ORF g.89360 m.89360 type:complete len:179 (+) comp51032_c0_seq4:20-556(+)
MATSTKSCSTPGCSAEASLQCPTCLKLGIKDGSFFCNQDCFKKSWSEHKAVHKTAAPASATPQPITWPGFLYSGTLRAYPQTPKRTLPASIRRPDYAETGDPISEKKAKEVNRILSADEIEKMRVVCKLGREVLDEAARAIAVGVTCDELDRVVHEVWGLRSTLARRRVACATFAGRV